MIEPVVERLHLQVRLEGADDETAPDSLFPDFEASRQARAGTYLLRWSGGALQAVDEDSGGVLATGQPGERLSFAGIGFEVPNAPAAGVEKLAVLPFEQAVDHARRRVSAKPAEQQANVVRLTCDGPSAVSAQDLCRGVSDSYLALRSELQTAEASAAATFSRVRWSRSTRGSRRPRTACRPTKSGAVPWLFKTGRPRK